MRLPRGIFGKLFFRFEGLMKSSTSGLRETREPLWLRSVWQEVKVGWPDSKGATFATNATREAMALQKRSTSEWQLCFVVRPFNSWESARQTAPTKRKVYEDFTRTLMRRRESRVWSSYWKRRRDSDGFVCVVVSLHHRRQSFTIRAIRPQAWQRAQTVPCAEGTAPEEQTRRVREACKVSKAGTGFQVQRHFA